MNFYDYEVGFEAEGNYYYDILFSAFFRLPLTKQATYNILRVNLPPLFIQSTINNIRINQHTPCKLVIFLVDRNNNFKRVKKLFYKSFIILNLQLMEAFIPNKDRLNCKLLLGNPILYYMNHTNTYNKILENVTAYDVINDFESFIKTTHGDTFYKNHIGTSVNLNSYVYEQILIRLRDDLNVPTEIIDTYKPFHTLTYYLFDDFHLSDICDKDISCTYLNLYDKDQLAKFDITEYSEILQNIKYIKETKINDDLFTVDKKNETININHQDIYYDNLKAVKSVVPKQTTVMAEKFDLIFGEVDYERKMYYTQDQQEQNPITPSSMDTNIYAPDSIGNGNARYSSTKSLLNDIFFNVTSMECHRSFVDWLQFGKLYNFELDPYDTNLFYYTPISIINIFQRKVMKEHYMEHIMKFDCIKYLNPERDAG